MEEQSAFLLAISSAVLVGFVIVLLFLMVLISFLTVLCFRSCRRSRSEESRRLLEERESRETPETSSATGLSYGTISPRSTPTRSIDIQQPRRVREGTRQQQENETPPTSEVAQHLAETLSENSAPQTSSPWPERSQEPTAEISPAPTGTEWLSTNNNVREVLNAVWPARLHWYLIGVQLGLQIVQLNVIRHNRRDNPDECIVDMIETWLNQEGATWRELISALKHEMVGCSEMASSIAASLNLELESTEDVEILDSSAAVVSPVTTLAANLNNDPLYSDSAYSTDSSFEHLDTSKLTNKESRRLKARLRKDTRRIITDFSDLVLHMRGSFKQRKINPQDLATTVKGIAKREPGTHSLQESMNLSAVTSIDVLVDKLQNENYISFINYHLVEYMISQYGSEEDKRKFAYYETKFKEYCKRSVFEVPQDVFGCVPSDGEKLAFKVTKEVVNNFKLPANHTQVEDDEYASDNPTAETTSKHLELSLGDVMFIEEKVSETLDLDVGSLVLLGASRGCLELTFSVPKVIVIKVKAQLEEVNGPVYSNLEVKGVHVLCGPPGKPQVTKVRNICYRLQWTKPSYQGFHPIQHYKISYRSVQDRPKVWRTFETESPTESIALPDEIIHPQHESSFVFKVQAVTDIGCGLYSEESDPVILQPLSATDALYRHTLPRSQKKHPLTIDDLEEVMDKLKPLKERWYDIGQKLDIDVTTLDEIQRTYNTLSIRLNHMFLNWLSQGGATREALSSALDSLGLYDASDSISARASYASATNSPSRSRSNTSIPFITLSSSSSCTTEADAPYHHTLPMISSRSRSFSERHEAQENHSLTSDDLLK